MIFYTEVASDCMGRWINPEFFDSLHMEHENFYHSVGYR